MSNTNIYMGYGRWNKVQTGKVEFSLSRVRKVSSDFQKKFYDWLQKQKADKAGSLEGSPQKF